MKPFEQVTTRSDHEQVRPDLAMFQARDPNSAKPLTRPDFERIESEQVLRRKFPQAQWGSEIVGDIDALLVSIDELTNDLAEADELNGELEARNAKLKQKADGWIAQAEIWRTGNVKIVDKLRQSTSSYEDRIDELVARNAKLEAVAVVDVRDMANFCIAQGASKPWQEIAHRLLAALAALDDRSEERVIHKGTVFNCPVCKLVDDDFADDQIKYARKRYEHDVGLSKQDDPSYIPPYPCPH